MLSSLSEPVEIDDLAAGFMGAVYAVEFEGHSPWRDCGVDPSGRIPFMKDARDGRARSALNLVAHDLTALAVEEEPGNWRYDRNSQNHQQVQQRRAPGLRLRMRTGAITEPLGYLDRGDR